MLSNRTVTVRGCLFNLDVTNGALENFASMNHEPEVLDFIDAMEPQSVLYDLGACEGRFTLYAAAKGHKVYAFEPERDNKNILDTNLWINPSLSGSVTAFKTAIGDRQYTAEMKVGQKYAGGHHKVIGDERPEFKVEEVQEVFVIDLNTFVKLHLVNFPTYIKVDIDGSELEFVDGAGMVLSDNRLKGVMFEMPKNLLGMEVMISMTGHGFQIKSIHPIPDTDLVNVWFTRPMV